MSTKNIIYAGTTALFILSAALLSYFHALQAKSILAGHPLPITLWTLLLLTFVFVGTLALINRGFSILINKIDALQNQLSETDRALQEAQANFDETVEQRTFEISVINASLNREIAERIQAETEGKKLQRRMELILNSAGEGIFGLDNKGNVTFANKAASLMLGWSPEELSGKSHHDLVHHTHADGTVYKEEDCPIYMAYKDGKVHFKSDDVFWTKDGSHFSVEYVSTPILEEGHPTGAVVVFRDLNTFT